MTQINKVAPAGSKMRSKAHSNFMAGPSYDINNPFLRLQTMAASCLFGEPTYYNEKDSKGRKRIAGATLRSNLSGRLVLEYLHETLISIEDSKWHSLSPTDKMVKAIDAALDADVERTLAVAATLRNEWLIPA